MAFIEKRFPTCISYGSAGGPGWDTTVVSFKGGEARNQNRQHVRYRYDAAYGVKTFDDLRKLIAFFNECRGRLHGFRYRDPLDYQAADEPLAPTGGPTVPLIKTYGDEPGYAYVRRIKKPVAGITMKRNGALYTGFTLDTTTGIVTLTPLSAKAISGISKASPGVVTCNAHGYSNGDVLYLSGIGGMTQLNGQLVTITVIDANRFSIGVDTRAYSTYSSGGTAAMYVQPTDALTWSGEFDVPCRFDTDELSTVLENYQMGSTSVPIVEDRNA